MNTLTAAAKCTESAGISHLAAPDLFDNGLLLPLPLLTIDLLSSARPSVTRLSRGFPHPRLFD